MFQPIAKKIAIGSAAALLVAGGVGGIAIAASHHDPQQLSVATTAATSTASSTAATTSTAATAVATSAAKKAKRAAALQTVLDQLVGQGKITSEQEGIIETALRQYQQQGTQVNPDVRAGLHTTEQQAILTALNMSAKDFRKQRLSGATIAQIAQTQGVSSQAVSDAVMSAVKKNLDGAAALGGITPAGEQALLAQVNSRLPQLLNATTSQHNGGGKRQTRTSASSTNSASTATSSPEAGKP